MKESPPVWFPQSNDQEVFAGTTTRGYSTGVPTSGKEWKFPTKINDRKLKAYLTTERMA
jgi:hypothetical protein